MYGNDEGEEGGSAGPSIPFDSGFKPRFGAHFEGFIPIILIIIIGFLLLARMGIISENTFLVGNIVSIVSPQEPSNMLIIGSPSIETLDVLNHNKDLVRYTIKSEQAFVRNPAEQISQYDILMLDQSLQASKEISRQLGDAINNYVKTGGKLVIVKDSGIRRPGAFDVLGWQANLGNIVPVSCDVILNGQPVCAQPITVFGVIWRQDFKHAIMQGIERVPAEVESGYLLLETFDVGVTGNEIAYIEDVRTGANYPAIVEQSQLGGGKVLYFNYNPGLTVGIMEATLKYLR
jgi:hypothetical protein